MSPRRKKPRILIGRRDKIDFPDLSLENVDAKVDTGAFTSSIHCRRITIINRDGQKRVRFDLLDPSTLFKRRKRDHAANP